MDPHYASVLQQTVPSYLLQLSDESGGQPFFDEPLAAGAEPICEPAVLER